MIKDDFWHDNKISSAVELLKNEKEKPALYYSEVNIVDKNLNFISKTNYCGIDSVGASFSVTPVIGCTLVINKKLRDIVIKHIPEKIAMHDSWIYRVCLAISGTVIHDHNAYIDYRQHENNVIGISASKIDKIRRYIHHKGNRVWTAKNLLETFGDRISTNNKETILKIAMFKKNKNIIYKFSYIFDRRYRSHKLKSDFKFALDILSNKL